MRTLVTGAAGFVGRHLLRTLLEAGDEVAATVLDDPPAPGGSLSAEEIAAVRWLPLDLTSGESVRAAVEASRPARVYHLAGQASVGLSFRDPLGTWEVNATGTLRLLDALARAGCRARVLVVSSAEVYGAVPEEEQPIPESAALRPITPYGASKAAAELVALQAAGAGELEVVVTRSFNHAGPGQDARFVFPSMAQQLVAIRRGEAEPVLRVGNLEARRDFLDVRDVVRAYTWLMERGESGRVYNVCSGRSHSLLELVRELVALSGTGARIEVDPERFRPADIPLLVGDAGALRALGWDPAIPLRQTLVDMLQSAESA